MGGLHHIRFPLRCFLLGGMVVNDKLFNATMWYIYFSMEIKVLIDFI